MGWPETIKPRSAAIPPEFAGERACGATQCTSHRAEAHAGKLKSLYHFAIHPGKVCKGPANSCSWLFVMIHLGCTGAGPVALVMRTCLTGSAANCRAGRARTRCGEFTPGEEAGRGEKVARRTDVDRSEVKGGKSAAPLFGRSRSLHGGTVSWKPGATREVPNVAWNEWGRAQGGANVAWNDWGRAQGGVLAGKESRADRWQCRVPPLEIAFAILAPPAVCPVRANQWFAEADEPKAHPTVLPAAAIPFGSGLANKKARRFGRAWKRFRGGRNYLMNRISW